METRVRSGLQKSPGYSGHNLNPRQPHALVAKQAHSIWECGGRSITCKSKEVTLLLRLTLGRPPWYTVPSPRGRTSRQAWARWKESSRERQK